VTKIERFTELLSKEPSQQEQIELETLRRELRDGWSSGDNALNRQADVAVSQVLDSMIEFGRDREIVEAQVRHRLAELFGNSDGTS